MTVETILGIDYGLKRVGVATGNTLTHSAEPLMVIQRNDDTQVIRVIAEQVREWQANAVAIGVPRHPDGTSHEMTAACLTFIAQLRQTLNIKVIEVDERYTSAVIPSKTTRKANGKRRTAIQDDQAAAVILQQHLSNL